MYPQANPALLPIWQCLTCNEALFGFGLGFGRVAGGAANPEIALVVAAALLQRRVVIYFVAGGHMPTVNTGKAAIHQHLAPGFHPCVTALAGRGSGFSFKHRQACRDDGL